MTGNPKTAHGGWATHYMMVQRVDSTRREYQEAMQPDLSMETVWFLTSEAFLGEFAIMNNGALVTDFIFDGSSHQMFIAGDNFYFARVTKF